MIENLRRELRAVSLVERGEPRQGIGVLATVEVVWTTHSGVFGTHRVRRRVSERDKDMLRKHPQRTTDCSLHVV